MTTPSAESLLQPDQMAGTGTERQVLAVFLDMHRAVLRRKVLGLSEQDARRSLVPSPTTLAGLLKHLAAVEREWFQHFLAQRSDEEIGADWRGENSWLVGSEDTVASLVADYDAACARSREIADGLELDHSVPHEQLGAVSLRWIYVHMVEETARHVGHADILREQTDGATGVDG